MITGKIEILSELKEILSGFSNNLRVTRDGKNGYELYTTKSVTVGKKIIEGMYFASVVIQGGFVGFYFFPIYTHPHEFKDIPLELKNA